MSQKRTTKKKKLRSREKIMRRLLIIRAWVNDLTRTEAERDTAAQQLARMMIDHGITMAELDAITSEENAAHELRLKARSPAHVGLAQDCAALFGATLFYYPGTKTLVFIGRHATAVRAHQLMTYIDEQLEQRHPHRRRQHRSDQIDALLYGLPLWLEPEIDYYGTAINVLNGRLEQIYREMMKAQAAQQADPSCTALVPYQMKESVMVEERAIAGLEQQAEALKASAEAAAKEDTGPEMKWSAYGAQVGREIRIPVSVTMQGGVALHITRNLPAPATPPVKQEPQRDKVSFDPAKLYDHFYQEIVGGERWMSGRS